MGNDDEVDFFRDTKVRYLGYANDVGEAFRPLVPRRVVRISYQIAFAYELADTVDKSIKGFKRDGQISKMMIATGDALIWQTLASVVIPGVATNRIVYHTGLALKRRQMAPLIQKLGPVAVGLACIPIIIKPIDKATDIFMNMTYRAYFGY